MITAFVIFLATYIFIGLRQIPRVHIDRPAGALVGAVLMVVTGVLTLDQAFAAVDLHTLLLLLGMMIITVYLRMAGFFELMAYRIISLSRTPMQLLMLITVSSGFLSALFVNDTICLLYTPIILEVTNQLAVNPMPYLLALATASNIGSVMTVTGNPQNMLIGIYSKIPYLSFFSALFPVTIIGLLVSAAVIRVVYHNELSKKNFGHKPALPPYYVNRPLLIKSLMVSGLVLAAFSAGFPYSLSAAAGAVLLMLIGGVQTERVLEGVDWTLLLFFSGLFVVMRGVEASGLAGRITAWAGDLSGFSTGGRIAGLAVVSAFLSNVVSNVPAVMLLKSFIESLGSDKILWLALAMSSTLAGNFTLIGSVANLIVAQQARRKVEIGFFEYFRVGAIITLITLAVGIMVLVVEAKIARGESSKASAAENLSVLIIPSDNSENRELSVALLCDNEEKRVRGLQGFRILKHGEAALFVFDRPQLAAFWMARVAYAIDIIFADEQGVVTRVFEDCRPGSRKLYESGGLVKWVVETAAGSGVKAGDRIEIHGR